MGRGVLYGEMVGVLVISFRVRNSNFFYLFANVFCLKFET